jgi:CDGSH-type Zn-finger protein
VAIVEPLENGPYLVKNLESLSNSKRSELPTKEVLALCRCGHSTNKPFCTGTHKEIGFDAPWGEGASREHYALCRCGQSKNKPFCDGSHWYAEFRDDLN